MEIRPRLKEIGSFGLQPSIKFAEVVIPMGLRRRITVAVDDPRGVRAWKFIYKVLPGTPDGGIQTESGYIESRADYLWNFFCARKSSSPSSFIVTCPRDGKDYLAEFAQSELTYEMFMCALYSSSLSVIQVDEPDVSMLEDGSLGDTSGNNQMI